MNQNALIICLCLWEHPEFDAEVSLNIAISCSVSISVFFLRPASHLGNISLPWFWKDAARKQQDLLYSTAVQTCQCCMGLLLFYTEESIPASSETYCKKVNGLYHQKVYSWTSSHSEQESVFNQMLQHKKRKEGGKCTWMSVFVLGEAALVCLFQPYPSCTGYASKRAVQARKQSKSKWGFGRRE